MKVCEQSITVVGHLPAKFFTMGNLCTRRTSIRQSLEDPVSGLTLREIDLIRRLWAVTHGNINLVEASMLFFNKLFERYPYMKDYFPQFTNATSMSMEINPAFRAHSLSVFVEIAKYVDYIEDAVLLVALIKKRTRGHFAFGVTCNDMENLKDVFLEFLKERGIGMVELPEALEAWDKFLTVHNVIFEHKTGELVDKRFFSEETLPTTEASTKKSPDHEVESRKSERLSQI